MQRFYETPAPLKAGRDIISERLKFLSPQPRNRDLRFTPTSSGEFKFKNRTDHSERMISEAASLSSFIFIGFGKYFK